MQDFYKQVMSTVQGRGAEVRQYLKHFARIDSQKFALLLIEETLSDSDLGSLAQSLTFIHKCGLFPIVLHRDSLTWDHAGRVPVVSQLGLPAVARENLRILEAIESTGGRAKPLVGGVFTLRVEPSGEGDRGGLQGPLESLLAETCVENVNSVVRLGHLPVIAPLGISPGGRYGHLNPHLATLQLASVIQPHKVILINSRGGLERAGRVLSSINLMDEFPGLAASPEVTPEAKDKLSLISSILHSLPPTSSVAVTSAHGLVDELFTHIGSREGTLVRLGMRISIHQDFSRLDVGRLTVLLEKAFGKTLHEDYFTRLRTIPFRVYLTGDYRGCAILTYEGGVPYLCKFAVHPQSQGLGIADILWAHITRENRDLFWRSREDNGVNNWYFARADGAYRAGRWTVFWYGLQGFDLMQFYKDYSMNLPPTFHQKIEDTFS